MIAPWKTWGNLGMREIISSYVALAWRSSTKVSFAYRSVHTLSENKLATAQTDEKSKR